MDPRTPPGFTDELLKAAAPTLQAISDSLGERTRNGKLDDDKKDAHGRFNTTHETLKNLSVVANKAGPEGVKLLGQTLAAATPDKSELNQFDDKLKALQKEKTPGLDKLAGSLVTELEASGKSKAAKELRKEHVSLAELPPPPPPQKPRWEEDMKLADAHNAHSTNTRGDFNKAAKGDYNWMEGDVSMEINDKGRIEMRHDPIHEKGDNLTLTEWLNKGKELGVGLKLDVKDEAVFGQGFLNEVRAAGVPEHQLMFNYGFQKAADHGVETRAMFPGATIAINPPSPDKVPKGSDPISEMVKMVETGGVTKPVTFVFEYGKHPTNPADIARLQDLGPISVWRGATLTGMSEEDATRHLKKDLGYTGMIDLKETAMNDPGAAIKDTVDKGMNYAVDFAQEPGKYLKKLI
ncbi:FAM151A/B family protein [Myxococcus sp. CA040A]|uniref:DUF2181 domain-containing protein n=2 Tax=Myxococcus llanfairpwllgwyngyllgogerychwyrndrobwllllantysiliogogogochensis TaxID=2590453 RepID=A0A540WHW6_9BACT|nr:DUF2181 domain-containing protein [Myxococcus sp. CA040A]NTX08559.1 DUF2181 domain-containing protein [Myxococcus sp. CA040A]TQF08598.1 DUF2181 domain-containing protein [Myxococcus llanfairpwllgwyngyllgogerychwyrndrobwllllantysiliogogogochensis]